MKESKAGANKGSVIFWFRQDLRLSDNPGLKAAQDFAANHGGQVLPVYIWAPEEEGDWPPGAATKVWLHHSLAALDESLRALGDLRLIFMKADGRPASSLEALQNLAKECGAGAVYWNRRYEPAAIARDKEIKAALKEDGLTVETFNGSLLVEPWELMTKEGKPYQVFTPFWRSCLAMLDVDPPLRPPTSLPSIAQEIHSESSLAKLNLLPKIKWDGGITSTWKKGEIGAQEQLHKFLKDGLGGYQGLRNRPDIEGVSRMSPHLHFGEISPRQIWYAVKKKVDGWRKSGSSEQTDKAAALSYLREVGWREFSHHLLYHFPFTASEPLRPEFKHFPWVDDQDALKAWQKGLTGYPIVDAGMRELWHTGIMHNRVRMVVASFLVKDLRLPWQDGARWFWDTLVDADLAQNTMGWQWTAGCGADAAPYFRVFNPVLQGEKFDPDGEYVRKWVPELAKIKSKNIHQPWTAPLELAAAGITLGEDYPNPIVDHSEARQLALAAFQTIKERKAFDKTLTAK